MHNQIFGSFIFAESTITAVMYLDMLKHYVVPQLQKLQLWIVFPQESVPPHWGMMVCDFLNETFPNRWIGRSCRTPWPKRSPDITPLDSFVGLCKRRIVQNTST